MFLPVEYRNEIIVDTFIDRLKQKTDMFHYTDEDIYKEKIISGDYLMWMFKEVAVVGKPYLTDTKIKGIEMDTASCSPDTAIHDSFNDCLNYIEEEAKSNGFFELRFSGRRGWRKIYPSFKELHTTYVKEL